MNAKPFRWVVGVALLPMFCALLLVGCSGSATHTVTSIAVTPATASIAVGATQQFTATATYGNGSHADVTSSVTWASGTKATATISATGLATAVAPGSSLITATLGTVSGTANLTVTPSGATLVSIAVTPASASIPVGGTADFVATGTFSDMSTSVLAGATWNSATPATASINGNGVAIGLAPGTSAITATFSGITSPAVTLTVATAVARVAYVPGTIDGNTAHFILNPATPRLIPIGSESLINLPSQIIPEPSGRFAFSLSAIAISTSLIDSAGRLSTLQSSLPITIAAQSGVVDPSGQFLYVVASDGTTAKLLAFAVNLTDGSLTPVSGSPYTVGLGGLFSVVTDRAGKFLYGVDAGSNSVFAFSIGTNGALTPLTTPSYPTGASPQFAAVDPSNTHLYIPNFTDNTISAFTINGDGSLTAVTGSPFSTGVGSGPEYIAVEATGKFLYVSNANDNTISALTIGSGGALGAAVAGSPFSTGATPVGIAIDPSNTTLAVANLFGNSVSLFSLNSTSGVLTPAPLPLIEASANPFFINYGLGTTALSSPVGAVFAANAVSGDISAFTSTSSTGVLTAATGSPVPGLAGNNYANADLRGRLLFVGGGTQVEGFAIDQTAGGLITLTGSPLSVTGTDTGSAVYVTPTEQFAYVLDSTSGSLVQNRVDVFAGTVTGPGTSTPAFTGASNLAADTQGDFIYVLGQNATNGIQPFTTYTTTGGINASTQSPALPGNWTSGSVDATGQYFVAVDSTAKTLQSFSITPAGTGSGSDGSLTPIGGAVTLSGTGPWVVTFDPLDRAVFVADQTLGTVLPFAFDLSTGTIGLAGTTTNVSANGVTQINADATGSYLYVGVAAASAPGSTGGISIYTIGAGGSLTAVPGSPFTTGTGNPAIANTNNVQ